MYYTNFSYTLTKKRYFAEYLDGYIKKIFYFCRHKIIL
jgi:hypothetical protein